MGNVNNTRFYLDENRAFCLMVIKFFLQQMFSSSYHLFNEMMTLTKKSETKIYDNLRANYLFFLKSFFFVYSLVFHMKPKVFFCYYTISTDFLENFKYNFSTTYHVFNLYFEWLIFNALNLPVIWLWNYFSKCIA